MQSKTTSNEALSLRAFEDKDLELLERWLEQPHVAKWFTSRESWLYEAENREGEFSFVHHFIAEYDFLPIGFCQYYEYERSGEDWHGSIAAKGAYSIDYLIGEKEFLGKGLAKRMLELLAEIVSREERAKRIIVQPLPQNLRSRSLLQSCNFDYDSEHDVYVREL